MALYAKAHGFRTTASDLAERGAIVARALVANDRVRLRRADCVRATRRPTTRRRPPRPTRASARRRDSSPGARLLGNPRPNEGFQAGSSATSRKLRLERSRQSAARRTTSVECCRSLKAKRVEIERQFAASEVRPAYSRLPPGRPSPRVPDATLIRWERGDRPSYQRFPPPPRPPRLASRGRASLTVSIRPPTSRPFKASIALAPGAFQAYRGAPRSCGVPSTCRLNRSDGNHGVGCFDTRAKVRQVSALRSAG